MIIYDSSNLKNEWEVDSQPSPKPVRKWIAVVLLASES